MQKHFVIHTYIVEYVGNYTKQHKCKNLIGNLVIDQRTACKLCEFYKYHSKAAMLYCYAMQFATMK